jgi:hypothetical protein
MAEPTIERIDDDIQVVSFDTPQPQAPVSPRPASPPKQNANSDSGLRTPDSRLQNMTPPENYMETIIKPVGQNVELPTDSMPEFRKQPPPVRGAPPPNQAPGPNPQPQPKPQTPPKNDGDNPPPSKIKHNYW